MWKVGNSNPGQVKPVIHKVDNFDFLAWQSALLGEGKDWSTQYQDNVNWISVELDAEFMVLVAWSPSGTAL